MAARISAEVSPSIKDRSKINVAVEGNGSDIIGLVGVILGRLIMAGGFDPENPMQLEAFLRIIKDAILEGLEIGRKIFGEEEEGGSRVVH